LLQPNSTTLFQWSIKSSAGWRSAKIFESRILDQLAGHGTGNTKCTLLAKNLFNQLLGEDEGITTLAQDSRSTIQELFQLFFSDEIKDLVNQEKPWTRIKKRKTTLLDGDCIPSTQEPELCKLDIWNVELCAIRLDKALNPLKDELEQFGIFFYLVWDEEELPAPNFVTACANIRMHIFNHKTSY
jgi:hypothetical protein